MSQREDRVVPPRAFARAIGFFDISGSTALWHEARFRDRQQGSTGPRPSPQQVKLAGILADFFALARRQAEWLGLVFVNTTGDGFVVASRPTFWSPHGRGHRDGNYHPCQILYDYGLAVASDFEKHVKRVVRELQYVNARVATLRIGFHYGQLYELNDDEHPLFFGDALNLSSRLLDSKVARTGHPACSYQFFKRFHRLGRREPGAPQETIIDRNRYPEPIDVYDLYSAQGAHFRIDRVREFEASHLPEIEAYLSDLQAVRALMKSTEVSVLPNCPDALACYSYRFPSENQSTHVHFSIDGDPDGRFVAAGKTRIRIRHSGFEGIKNQWWVREIREWGERLATLTAVRSAYSMGSQVSP